MNKATRAPAQKQPTSAPARPRKPLQPASGSARWIQRPDAAGVGAISINSKAYLLTAVRDHTKADAVVCYRLAQADGTVYDVVPGEPHWHCDCGDYTFNRDRAPTPELRECKHCRALRNALLNVGQTPVPVEPFEPLGDPSWVDGDPFAYSVD